MKKLRVLIFLFLVATTAHCEVEKMVRIKAIGSSPRGQFVAFEEFGYESNNSKRPYSNIRIFNAWKNKVIKQQSNYSEEDNSLQKIRELSFERRQNILKKYNIST